MNIGELKQWIQKHNLDDEALVEVEYPSEDIGGSSTSTAGAAVVMANTKGHASLTLVANELSG